MLLAQKLCQYLETLKIPEGKNAGKRLRLAPYQRKFVAGAIRKDIRIGVLSIGRGNGKTALAAGIALSALTGVIDQQARREVIVAARTKDQARVAFEFVCGFIGGLPASEQKQFLIRRSPSLIVTYQGQASGHTLKVIAADGKTALGTAPTLVLMDERAHWADAKGNALEAALMSGLGKRSGRCLIISTSAETDTHPFSVWVDQTIEEGIYVQEHRPETGLPADDLASLKVANPGASRDIGSSLEWLQAEARRAIRRGGKTLAAFKLYNRNERVSAETREALITVEEWLRCEVENPPERSGKVIMGLDLGGSAAMSAAAFYWPSTGRLETLATFPSQPSLETRGERDAVAGLYREMENRGELNTLGKRTVPIAEWLNLVLEHVKGGQIEAILADRFKQSELGDAIDKSQVSCPVIWRGMGFKDGGEDCERFRRAVFEGRVKTRESVLMRSSLENAVCFRDPADNIKLVKGRSKGRIDAVAASVLAVAHGERISTQRVSTAGLFW